MRLSFIYIGIFFYLLLSSNLYALKPVTMEGKAPFAKGKEIWLYRYDDLFNKKKVFITKTTVDDSGNFLVQVPILETQELLICFNTTEGSLFVEPEKNYSITLYTNEQLINRLDAKSLGNSIQIEIHHTDTNELNWKINYFNQFYNYFLFKHSLPILNMVNQSVYDSLLCIITDKFPLSSDTNDFYSIYVKFRIAEIERMYYKKSPYRLYIKYLDNKYVHYHNPAYMDFFTAFFNSYLYTGSKQITKEILYQDINHLNNYFKLLDDMGKDPILVNEIIREMALIQNLANLFAYYDEFNRSNILSLLKHLSATTKFPEHKIMAENKIKSLINLQVGSKAPEFTAIDIHNNTISLSDYKGSYVFLHFFTKDCEECIREMLIIKNLFETYNEKVQFISVMLDFEPTQLYHFVNAYPDFKWKFVHFNNDFSFIENYRLYALPLGMLIDSAGQIISYPSPAFTELGNFFSSHFENYIPQTSPPK
ncbi:MAG: redoxin domain-containing protein [Bacteroidales bacterium]|nr:redoxin domain-containing protein [Bacteroidales bacterium]MDD4210312.1 redoxin domain-containing protein [Bacteroidales bacterium]